MFLTTSKLNGQMVRSGKGMKQTIAALTSNGSLCLTNTSDTPISGLLLEMEKILNEACQGDTEHAFVPGTDGQTAKSCTLA